MSKKVQEVDGELLWKHLNGCEQSLREQFAA